jgi:hypothetical protein
MSEKQEEFCNPNKACKNMEHVHYGFTPQSWKDQLKKDNKFSDDNKIIDFVSKSQMRRIAKEKSHDVDEITDEDFQVFLKALFGDYKGGAYQPE